MCPEWTPRCLRWFGGGDLFVWDRLFEWDQVFNTKYSYCCQFGRFQGILQKTGEKLMLDLAHLTISKVTVHHIPSHGENKAVAVPTGAQSLVVLTNDAKD